MSDKTLQAIPVERIVVNKQVREQFDQDSLLGLTQSLRESGLHEPIHVVALGGDQYGLLTGERRLRAARQAGWTSISAIVEEGALSREEILVRQILENCQREDLGPIERAKALGALMKESGWNASQTADRLGMASGTVAKLLALLSLPQPLQEQVRDGKLPATVAYQLTTVPDEAERAELAARAIRGELTRDQIAIAVRARKTRKRKPSGPRLSRFTAKLPQRQSVIVTAPRMDLEAFLTLLQTLAARAGQAQNAGLSLDGFLKQLSNESRSANSTQSV